MSITNEKLIGHGLISLKDIVEHSAPLIKRFESVYVLQPVYISFDMCGLQKIRN